MQADYEDKKGISVVIYSFQLRGDTGLEMKSFIIGDIVMKLGVYMYFFLLFSKI